LIFVLAPAAVVQAAAQEVHVDYDHGCAFSRYKTYAWEQPQPQRPPSSRALFPNQLMQERIIRFVEEALAAKGLARTETGADVLVAYEVKVSEEPQFTTYADSMGPGWGWDNWGCCGWSGAWGGSWGTVSTTTTEIIRLGTLVINLTDSHQKQLVFQGLSTAAVSSKAEKNIKRLQKGVSEIFEKYPPQKKG